MSDKITIVRTSGCTAGSITVNGKLIDELSYSESKRAHMALIRQLIDQSQSQCIDSLLYAVNPDSSEFDERQCDQCGDYVETETWIV